MSANLLMVNEDTEGIAGEVLAARPDVLLVQELSPRWLARFEQPDLSAALPYRSAVARTDSFGIGVYSRTPLVTEQLDLSGLPAFRADVKVRDKTLRIFNFHTLPPRTPSYVPTWNAMMARIVTLVGEQHGPLLLGGDLNATPHTAWFRRLLATGLRGAHEERGRALATTWPNGLLPLPPIRLDHLLVSPHIQVLGVIEGEGRGSDHRPVIGDFALAP
jgi:endonuclease/exonuclease/phosphatase (EEP) superfamily protein YafD